MKGGERMSFRSVEDKLDKWSDMLNPAVNIATSFMRVIGRASVVLFTCCIFCLLVLLFGYAGCCIVSVFLGSSF